MNTNKMYVVHASGEIHFFDNKKDALNDVRSAIDFELEPRLYEIKKPTEEYLSKVDEEYSSVGKVDSPMEKYFWNECLASSDLSICVEVTI